MRVSDLLGEADEQWLQQLAKQKGDDILKVFLVYNDRKFGLDSAKDIFDQVVGLDFIAAEESGIISNEEIRTNRQQGMEHSAPEVPEEGHHHWWVEATVDLDLKDLIKLAEPKKAKSKK